MVNTNFICVATADAIPRLLRLGWSLDIQLDAIHALWRGSDDTTRRETLEYRDKTGSLLGRDQVNDMCVWARDHGGGL